MNTISLNLYIESMNFAFKTILKRKEQTKKTKNDDDDEGQNIKK